MSLFGKGFQGSPDLTREHLISLSWDLSIPEKFPYNSLSRPAMICYSAMLCRCNLS